MYWYSCLVCVTAPCPMILRNLEPTVQDKMVVDPNDILRNVLVKETDEQISYGHMDAQTDKDMSRLTPSLSCD